MPLMHLIDTAQSLKACQLSLTKTYAEIYLDILGVSGLLDTKFGATHETANRRAMEQVTIFRH